MNVEVRDYQEDDLERVNEIISESFGGVKCEVTDDCFHEIVSLNDGEISGYLLLTRVFNPVRNKYYCLVDYVCVASKFRGSGASDKLIEYASDVAKKMGASYLQLTCSPFRLSAHKLYERCGFEKRETDVYRKVLV